MRSITLALKKAKRLYVILLKETPLYLLEDTAPHTFERNFKRNFGRHNASSF
jgi:hypothetical protein